MLAMNDLPSASDMADLARAFERDVCSICERPFFQHNDPQVAICSKAFRLLARFEAQMRAIDEGSLASNVARMENMLREIAKER